MCKTDQITKFCVFFRVVKIDEWVASCDKLQNGRHTCEIANNVFEWGNGISLKQDSESAKLPMH